jgi:hypothetical protein
MHAARQPAARALQVAIVQARHCNKPNEALINASFGTKSKAEYM